jgi:lipid-binding SYLF domain-containing protein
VARAGAGWSLGVGSGLVVARAPDGGWSPPCALLALSSGLGWQLGLEVQDMVLVLRTPSALAAFCAAQLGVGGSVGLAAGPLGRVASARALASMGGGALVYSYCLSRGAFAGVALEGTLLATRDALNQVGGGPPLDALMRVWVQDRCS